MKILMVRGSDTAITNVLAAIEPMLPPGSIEILTPAEKPAKSPENSLAQAIAEAVRPKPSHSMRTEALRFALQGGDTFIDQQGESDPSLRNALASLSKAMRPLFPHDVSPMDRLAVRTKILCKDSGAYLGTKYSATPLGKEVLTVLQQKKYI